MSSCICLKIYTKKYSKPGILSRFRGNQNKIEEHYIDWDISLALLSENNLIQGEGDFIYYNNPIFEDGIITLKSHVPGGWNENEFDEEIEIDFEKIPKRIKIIALFLSNHRDECFELTDFLIKIINPEQLNLLNPELYFSNKNSCNGIELLKLIRNELSNKWDIAILNTPITGPKAMAEILKKYSELIT
jgi:stress response protein SCP2